MADQTHWMSSIFSDALGAALDALQDNGDEEFVLVMAYGSGSLSLLQFNIFCHFRCIGSRISMYSLGVVFMSQFIALFSTTSCTGGRAFTSLKWA